MARVLVVDDNPDERHIYSVVLQFHGHQVEEAEDGVRGVELARASLPDVIVLDVHLPLINGLLAAELLRGGVDTGHIPIVCITGFDVERSRALAAGCSTLLRKPIPPRLLAETIQSLFPGTPEDAVPGLEAT